ncbi:uncharacterized protein LY79DRAFT_274027 [Colletotrichum navitas]|uniref:Uncharacterized protein n=1 Tax=Colletotrichum navitas TaxID=681940 RepID=A0AAD8V2V3_9PEZI|nr:uncharacterized protein LY79DRAFT_274027 [Colletotrichum navitas]KAK1585232.1 hypothetical protein LY79DRAFT_274027 [Colletotrichum navitas]
MVDMGEGNFGHRIRKCNNNHGFRFSCRTGPLLSQVRGRPGLINNRRIGIAPTASPWNRLVKTQGASWSSIPHTQNKMVLFASTHPTSPAFGRRRHRLCPPHRVRPQGGSACPQGAMVTWYVELRSRRAESGSCLAGELGVDSQQSYVHLAGWQPDRLWQGAQGRRDISYNGGAQFRVAKVVEFRGAKRQRGGVEGDRLARG